MIHILIGTRAQLIKMIPLMHLLQERSIDYNFIFMAQHRETIYEMLDDFNIKKPDYVLCDTGSDIVSSKQMIIWSLKVVFFGILRKSRIFQGDKKGIVLIHGDAPPLLLGAILAKVQGLSVASVEAGLRSFNFLKPFPEELTRVFTAKMRLVNLFFCQDSVAMENVKNYKGHSVNTYGNTIIDAIRLAKKTNQNRSQAEDYANTEKYAVVTLHRYETISNKVKFERVIELVLRIANHITVKFILHPPTREALKKHGFYNKLAESKTIDLLPRMSFLQFNEFISRSEFIVTDGGSNQEESAFLGIPCLLFRTETERREGLGANVVLSMLETSIIDQFLNNYKNYQRNVEDTAESPTELILANIDRYR